MMIGTFLNLLLDPLFLFVFKMGVQGAAIATVLGNAGALAYYIWFYLGGKSLVTFRPRLVRFDREIFSRIFGIGIPASVSQMMVSVAITVSNNLASSYGVVTVASMGIANKVMALGTFIFMGFAAGCQPLVGYNFGSGDLVRVRALIRRAMLITSLIGLVLTIVFKLFAPGLVALFAPGLPDMVERGAMILRALSWSLCALGPLMLSSTSIQAFGQVKASLFLSFARQGIFFIPLALLLNNRFQLEGLIHAQPLSDVMTVLVSAILLSSSLKRIFKVRDIPLTEF